VIEGAGGRGDIARIGVATALCLAVGGVQTAGVIGATEPQNPAVGDRVQYGDFALSDTVLVPKAKPPPCQLVVVITY
jgi:hypothetical protein